jgi:hypothetical protein
MNNVINNGSLLSQMPNAPAGNPVDLNAGAPGSILGSAPNPEFGRYMGEIGKSWGDRFGSPQNPQPWGGNQIMTGRPINAGMVG